MNGREKESRIGKGVERTEEERARENGREEVTLGRREIGEVKEYMRGEKRKRGQTTSERESKREGERERRKTYREDVVGEISGSKKGRR